jgi:hypothetical protein
VTSADFDLWFAKHIDHLNADPHGGFAVLMIAIPLLERYLREKSGSHEGNLSTAFYVEFSKLFPTVPSTVVDQFWHCYRNGLLHQATFSKKPHKSRPAPGIWITSRSAAHPDIINFDSTQNVFHLLPKEFTEKVVATIRSDFATYQAPGSPSHPPPTVRPAPPASPPLPPPSGGKPPPPPPYGNLPPASGVQ